MWKTDCETPTDSDRKRGYLLMKCEYEVERISGDLKTMNNTVQ